VSDQPLDILQGCGERMERPGMSAMGGGSIVWIGVVMEESHEREGIHCIVPNQEGANSLKPELPTVGGGKNLGEPRKVRAVSENAARKGSTILQAREGGVFGRRRTADRPSPKPILKRTV